VTMPEDTQMAQARELLSRAESVCVLSGAGVSAESGVPTFRGEGGLWKSHRAEELATPGAFRRDPRLVWEWYEWRREKIRACRPNPGHEALARLALELVPTRIVTQNVDNLHQEAGNKNVIEMHGNLFRQRCLACEARKPFGREEYLGRVKTAMAEMATFDLPSILEMLPKCDCGSPMRPDVVMFGEAVQGLYESFQEADGCDAMLVLGTSGVVYPAAALPQKAKEAGATVIEINPGNSAYFGVADIRLQGKTGEILPRIVEKIQNA
jgi:NAD-dependent deacetylase